MAKDKQLVLSPEEAYAVAMELLEQRRADDRPPSGLTPQQGLRLMAKLDRHLMGHVDFGTVFTEVPAWARQVLHQTYAPEPRPKKKPAPKRSGAGKRRASSAATSRPAPSPPVATAAVPTPGSPSSRPDGGAKLTASAARRRGGLLRAAQQAEAKGDHQKAAEYRNRIAALEHQVAAVAAHGGEAAGD